MAKSAYGLSKSRFLSGLQCHKRLYLETHQPELAAPVDQAQQYRFDQGHEVTRLARLLFPGGILVEHGPRESAQAVMFTRTALANNPPALFEPAFTHDGILVRADVLQRMPSGKWRLIEVKSSTELKDIHIPDIAVQAHVLQGAGLILESCQMMLISQECLSPNWDQLFRLVDVTRQVTNYLPKVPGSVARFREMLQSPDVPAIRVGSHCSKPFACQFQDHCFKNLPAHNVMELIRGGKIAEELLEAGIEELAAIPPNRLTLDIQDRQLECVREGRDWVSEELAQVLKILGPDSLYLDFEALAVVLPPCPGYHPYEKIPFQFSVARFDRAGPGETTDYLHSGPEDPCEPLALALLEALGKTGSICVYSSYESQIIKVLASKVSKLSDELNLLLPRLVDLLGIIREHYYHPEFHGSFSIKDVLPALVKNDLYKGLAIRDGSTAMVAFLEDHDPKTDPERVKELRDSLLRYCGTDARAMVEVHKALLKRLSK